MATKIDPLVLSYPNFTLGQIIDPVEANQNNYDITNKLNEFIDVDYATQLLAEEAKSLADGAVATANNASTLATNADAKANQAITDSQNALSTSNTALNTSNTALSTANQATTYTESAINEANDAIARAEQAIINANNMVGNTDIKYDVYTIINADNGDGTFTYSNGVDNVIGTLTPEGYQQFQLTGNYIVGGNRIEATINDSLTRSAASGGLQEIGTIEEQSNLVNLTIVVGNGAEITFRYYEQISLSGKHGMSHNVGGNDEVIKLSSSAPIEPTAGQWFFEVVS